MAVAAAVSPSSSSDVRKEEVALGRLVGGRTIAVVEHPSVSA